MGNQGWTNDAGAGIKTSSTARQSGRGTQIEAFDDFVDGSKCAAPGALNDPLSQKSDVFEPAGQAVVSPEI